MINEVHAVGNIVAARDATSFSILKAVTLVGNFPENTINVEMVSTFIT